MEPLQQLPRANRDFTQAAIPYRHNSEPIQAKPLPGTPSARDGPNSAIRLNRTCTCKRKMRYRVLHDHTRIR